jgi:hypothetical protein
MGIVQRFQEYFAALDRAGHEDRCFVCRRTPAEVKRFFGFHEDGTPVEAADYGLEDVVLAPRVDVMSYRGTRPICAVCQLNFDSIFLLEQHETLKLVLDEMEHRREALWPDGDPESDPESEDRGPDGEPGSRGA